MSSIQKLFTVILPAQWVRSMEAESRSWMIRGACGYERSVWDVGGIRWKARGTPKRYMSCQGCGQSSWRTVYWKPQACEDVDATSF